MDKEEQNIKYSSYTPAQKRATQKYRQNNKDKVNEQRKKYYQERKDKDPDFLKYKREKAKEYYQRRKNKFDELGEELEEVIELNEEERDEIIEAMDKIEIKEEIELPKEIMMEIIEILTPDIELKIELPKLEQPRPKRVKRVPKLIAQEEQPEIEEKKEESKTEAERWSEVFTEVKPRKKRCMKTSKEV